MSTRIFGGKYQVVLISNSRCIMNTCINRLRNFGILVAFLVFFSFTYVMAAELLASSPSKGEVLVFRKGLMESKAPKKGGQDEEKTDSHATTSLPRAHDRNSTTTLAATAKSEEQRPINFFWKDLCYNIEIKGEPRRLLNNVNGWVQPGKITALMVSDENLTSTDRSG